MTLICFASQKGSPGATLTALTIAATWPGIDEQRRVFVEADRAGGAVAHRYGLGTDPGLLTLAAAIRTDNAANLWTHAQSIPGGLPAVVAPDAPVQVQATLSAGSTLGSWLDERQVTAIADIGRLDAAGTSHPFLAHSSTIAVVVRPVAEQLQPATHTIRSLGLKPDRVGWVLVGDRPHGVAEVEATFGIPVLGVIAEDTRTAGALTSGTAGKRISKSPLVRSAGSLADSLAARALELGAGLTAELNGATT